MDKRKFQLEKLRAEIWKSASYINDEEGLIQELMKRAGPVLGAENISFMPFNKGKKEVVVKFVWRVDGKTTGTGDSVPAQIFKEYLGKEYIYLSFDNLPTDLMPILTPFREKYHTKTTLIIPFGSADNPEGFLSSNTYTYYKKYSKKEISIFQEVSRIICLRMKQIRAEKRLRNSELKLKKANETKDRFFSIIGHDLKNPINAITSLSELIESKGEKLKIEDALHINNLIRQTSKQAEILLENLLKWARFHTGKMDFNLQRVKLSDVVSHVISLCKASAEEKQLTLIEDYDKRLVILSDIHMLEFILRNFLSNAIKFSYEGNSIIIKASKDNNSVRIAVEDSGIGISVENINRLFKLEDNISTLGTKNEKGTGLGLIICNEFVKKHGSKIHIKSKPGEGSVFSFSLADDQK